MLHSFQVRIYNFNALNIATISVNKTILFLSICYIIYTYTKTGRYLVNLRKSSYPPGNNIKKWRTIPAHLIAAFRILSTTLAVCCCLRGKRFELPNTFPRSRAAPATASLVSNFERFGRSTDSEFKINNNRI